MERTALILPLVSSNSSSNVSKQEPLPEEAFREKKRELLEAYVDGKITLNGVMDTMYLFGKKTNGERQNVV
jgi:hypothetical protein